MAGVYAACRLLAAGRYGSCFALSRQQRIQVGRNRRRIRLDVVVLQAAAVDMDTALSVHGETTVPAGRIKPVHAALMGVFSDGLWKSVF